ncbi:hypothetical protein B0H34DRAFT_155018 [Crassisporium funariophilum]|nr:hypothetical protein B0H34DRAFT_155018 [Crassisporium funariophilum]
MENPSLVEDEVIADSEDEMEQDLLPAEGGLRGTGKHSKAATGNASSQVSAFTLTNHPHGKVVSSISAFPTNPSTSKEQIHGTAKTSDYGYPDYSVHLDDFIGAASIADRAKTRQRNTRPSTSSEVIELTSEEDELGLRPTPSKPRPRPKLKVKAKDSEIGQDKGKSKATFDTSLDLNIPNTSNSVPSIATDSNPKPRPRPRPVPKRPKGAHNESSNVPAPLPAPLPATPPTPYHGPELPVATSPPHPPPLTSQLPPSDPPLPTMTTTYGDDDVPRIETLPNDMDFDGPSSSPLSSVDGDRGGGGARNKRKRKELDVDIDELASSNAALGPPRGGAVAAGSGARHGFEKAAHISPRKMPPPPTFFAGSSSSSMGGGGGRVPPLEPAPEPDVVDLTMLPSTVDPTCIVAKKAVKPPAKPRKKKGEDADAMVVVLDEDEGDDDFNPGGRRKARRRRDLKPSHGSRRYQTGAQLKEPRSKSSSHQNPSPGRELLQRLKGKTKILQQTKTRPRAANTFATLTRRMGILCYYIPVPGTRTRYRQTRKARIYPPLTRSPRLREVPPLCQRLAWPLRTRERSHLKLYCVRTRWCLLISWGRKQPLPVRLPYA